MANTKIPVELSSTPGIVDNSNATAITIDSSENVGIGATSPSTKLEVSNGAITAGSSGTVLVGRNSSSFPDPGAGYFSLETNNTDGSNGGITIKTLASNTLTERLRIDASGNVGIGVSSPSQKLQIAGDVRVQDVGADSSLQIFAPSDSYSPYIHWAVSGVRNSGILGFPTGSNDLVYRSGASSFSDGTERMRIDGSGNVGIGTSSPSTALHIYNTSARPVTIGNASATWSLGTSSTNFAIRENSSGSDYVTIDSSGNLLVGTTTAVGKVHFSQSALDADVLQLTNSNSTRSYGQRITFSTDHNNTTSQFLKFKGSTTDRLIIYSNGNIQNTNNSYGALSDEKLKENIVDATNKLEDLKQVRIRNYNLIGEDKKQIGVIAQELETIFPNMVEESPDLDDDNNDLGTTTKSVKYSVFVPILIKAIQKQQTIIDDLKTRIEALEG